MSLVLGWALAGVALAWVALLRRRLRLVGRAEHELRGPVTVLSLAAERLRRDPAARRHALALESELARLVQGLDDLAAARHGSSWSASPPASAPAELARSALAGWESVLARGGRGARMDWKADGARVGVSPGRLAQALGNLLANAAEHGRGPVLVRGRRRGAVVRIEVHSEGQHAGRPAPGRGNGLAVAARTAREAGGRLELLRGDQGTVAALELPAVEDPPPDRAA